MDIWVIQNCRWLFFDKLAVHTCLTCSSAKSWSLLFQQANRENITKNFSSIVSCFSCFTTNSEKWFWSWRTGLAIGNVQVKLYRVSFALAVSLHPKSITLWGQFYQNETTQSRFLDQMFISNDITLIVPLDANL